jgi:diamine N-acetyltransferase
MNYSVYLRPLKLEDAKTSYQWRNNPLIWKFTQFKPDRPVNIALETSWLKKVLKNKTEYRFAICLLENGQYIGNIQLINVKNNSGCFHVFIGDPTFWGKGIGKEATALILNYGFTKLALDFITLEVHKDNLFANAVYQRMGFEKINENGNFIEMALEKNYFLNQKKYYKTEKLINQKGILN